MKNKKGEFTWAQVAGLLLIVVVLFIVITGSGGFFNKLFAKVRGIEENVGKELEGIDFGILNKEQEKKLCGDPQGFMSKLFNDAQKKRGDNDINGAIVLFERYIGICKGKKENAEECSDKEFVELKKYCDKQREINDILKPMKDSKIVQLEAELNNILNSKEDADFTRARQILDELKALGRDITTFNKRVTDVEKKAIESTSGLVSELGISDLSSGQYVVCSSRTPIEALKCFGSKLSDNGRYDDAVKVYSLLIRKVSNTNSPSSELDAYLLLGKIYQLKGDKSKYYNLYEDLVVKYEDKNIPEQFREAKGRLNEVAKNSDYKSIVRFSKLKYDTKLHGTVEEGGFGKDDYEWNAISTSGGEIIDNRAGVLPTKDGKNYVTFSYNPFSDWAKFGASVFGSGNTGLEPNGNDFECITENSNEGFFKRKWMSPVGSQANGFEIYFEIKDINNNLLLTFAWMNDGKKRRDLVNEVTRFGQGALRSDIDLGFWLPDNPPSCRDGENDQLNLRLDITGLTEPNLAEYLVR